MIDADLRMDLHSPLGKAACLACVCRHGYPEI